MVAVKREVSADVFVMASVLLSPVDSSVMTAVTSKYLITSVDREILNPALRDFNVSFLGALSSSSLLQETRDMIEKTAATSNSIFQKQFLYIFL